MGFLLSYDVDHARLDGDFRGRWDMGLEFVENSGESTLQPYVDGRVTF